MALGILSVSAGLGGEQGLSVVLLALALLALVVMAPWVLLARSRGSSPLQGAFAWLTWAAACGVLAARFGPSLWPAAYVLGGSAAIGWIVGEVLLARLLVAWPGGWRRWEVGGSWLLAVVATQSMSILASTIGGSGWTVVAAILWLLGAMAYVGLITLIVRRILLGQVGVERHTPDYWISMGGLAITTVAAFDLANLLTGVTREWFVWLGVISLVAAVLWIPYLLSVEALLVRSRSFQRAYDALRWSTVFPLGMLSVAIYMLSQATGAGNPIFAGAAFWAGLALALLNVAMLVRRNA